MELQRLRAAQAGDREARRELLDELGPTLAGLVRRAGERGDATDQLHDLFAHLLQVLPRFQPEGPAQLSTWAYTVAHRWLLMRRRKRVAELVPLEGGLGVAGRHDPEADSRGHQLSDRLEAALARLPEEQRRIFVLTQLYELPLDQVALAESLPVGTVKSRLFRARAGLALMMGDFLDTKGGAHARAGHG